MDYLRGFEEYVDHKGDIRERPVKQGLAAKLKAVPALLGLAMKRQYSFPQAERAANKLDEIIFWRDVIIHPRWDRYARQVGWYEAAQAIDAVELYLHSISLQLHPYLAFYAMFLHTIPAGGNKDDIAVGHRTDRKKPPERTFANMAEIDFPKIVTHEWFGMEMIVEFALASECEADSSGSMLTRSALVLLYAMLNAELPVFAQAYLRSDAVKFEHAEAAFLSETALGVDSEGQITVSEENQQFKRRLAGVPKVLARRVLGKELSVQLGDQAGEDLLRYKTLRDSVTHPRLGMAMPAVSKDELRAASRAVRAYFRQLANAVPEIFGLFLFLLDRPARPD